LESNIHWLGWVVISIFLTSILLIVFMLFSLSRRGDEREQFIKTKAMSTTFIWTVVILVAEAVRVLFASHNNGTNPVWILMFVSLIFLVSLVVYKKKYGDLA
jgi:ABC-type xylose transport system permease subunit